jgi:hypothetical protein
MPHVAAARTDNAGEKTIMPDKKDKDKPFNHRQVEVLRGVKRRRGEIESRIRRGRPALCDEVIQAWKAANRCKTDFDHVSELLLSNESTTRISAALCIHELASSWDGRSAYIQERATRLRLLSALNDEQSEVQKHMILALSKCRFLPAAQALPVLVAKLGNSPAEIQAAALEAIQSYEIDRASEHAPAIAKLLEESSDTIVQVQACKTLAFFGADAS